MLSAPSGDQWDRLDEDGLARVRSAPTFKADCLSAARRWRSAWNAILDGIDAPGLEGLRLPSGEPIVVIRPERNHFTGVGWYAFVSWGDSANLSTVAEHGEVEGQRLDLALLLSGSPGAKAYAALRDELDALLGCPLETLTWRNPHLVPSWVL